MIYADVLVAKRGSSETLTYAVPAVIIPYISRGRLVTVPVRDKKVRAIVINIHERLPAALRGKVREMIGVEREGGLSEGQMAAVHELAGQYLTNPSDILFRALQQPRLNMNSKTTKASDGRYFQASWPERKKQYRLLTHRYDETLLLFATQNHLQDFAAAGDIILDGSAKARKAVATAKPGTVFLGTVGDSFFSLKNRALVIVDQPDHVGAQYASRPFLKAGDVVQARAKHEGFDWMFGQAVIHPENLLAVQEKNITLESRVKTVPLLVCSRVGTKELLLPTVVEEIQKALAAKENVAVLVTSRGWANAFFCRDCRTVVVCKNCQRPAGVMDSKLHCRYCGEQAELPTTCPECSRPNLVAVGEGIDQVVGEIKKRFPHASLQVLAGNRKIELKNANITIATEKILSFPRLEFDKLMVASADRALSANAIDGPWRLLNILLELSGQAKRIVVQTYFPEHRVFAALSSGNVRAFFQTELEERRKYQLPPYGFTVRLRGVGTAVALERQVAELEKVVAAIPSVASSGLELVGQGGSQVFGELRIFSPISRQNQVRYKLAEVLSPNWAVTG